MLIRRSLTAAATPTEVSTPPLVTLTTDFGGKDPYVAAMKGVIRSRCPDVIIEDLSHDIAPQDILGAALFLATATPYFPKNVIHVAVIDPGVGTNRKPLVVSAGGQYFVCPDNGLLTLVAQEFLVDEIRVINNPGFMRETISPTFHGRDIFAPTAGCLAAGAALEGVGDPLDTMVLLDIPEPRHEGNDIVRGIVIHIDRFGNCITNIFRRLLREDTVYQVKLSDTTLPGIHETYGFAETGQPIAVFGSSGRLEIAVRNGNARDVLGLELKSTVTLYTP